MEDSKDEKNLLAGLNLHYVDAMALNDDENKVDQSLIFSFLPAFCRAEWPAETEVFKDSIESFSIDLSVAEDEVEDVVHLESW